MRDIIEVDKDQLPYSIDIALDNDDYNMYFMYNKTADLFTCTLSKDGEVLVHNEPIIYGVEMFTDLYISGVFPMLSIVPLDEAGNETAVTYENFGKTVFLTIDDLDESEAESE